jgi:hypothetical protein
LSVAQRHAHQLKAIILPPTSTVPSAHGEPLYPALLTRFRPLAPQAREVGGQDGLSLERGAGQLDGSWHALKMFRGDRPRPVALMRSQRADGCKCLLGGWAVQNSIIAPLPPLA